MNENKIICSHCGAVIDSDDDEEYSTMLLEEEY